MSEHQIEQSILRWLNKNNFFAWKPHDHPKTVVPFQIKGCSDIIALRNGKTYFIEVKTESGCQSEHQKRFQERVEAQGHPYLLVRSLEALKTILPLE